MLSNWKVIYGEFIAKQTMTCLALNTYFVVKTVCRSFLQPLTKNQQQHSTPNTMHRSIDGHSPCNLIILSIDYSNKFTTNVLLTIEHMALFVVKAIHI